MNIREAVSIMYKFSTALLGLMTLAACGGGGSSGFGGAPPPGGGGWTPGVFLDAGTFSAHCAAPRAGVDPAGNPFPDIQGTATDENNFLRSYSDDTYLWYDEITDRDPALHQTPDYFDDGGKRLSNLIVDASLASSASEAKRLINQGAVQLIHESTGETRTLDRDHPLPDLNRQNRDVLKVGRRRFVRLVDA